MTPVAPHIEVWLRQRLPTERAASLHTCDSYAYAFQLLFTFAAKRLELAPSNLTFEHLDVALVLAFLEHLQRDRGNGARSRNVRLAAIKSFMRFMEYRAPAALDQIRCVLAIPSQRVDIRLVGHLAVDEVQALLDAPDPTTREGIRDRALLHVAVTGGLRVSELVGLRMDDIAFRGNYLDLRVRGKGRKERALTLWKAVADTIRAWLAVRGAVPSPELFVNAHGAALTRSGAAWILRKHVHSAIGRCPSLAAKSVSPHVLRHTCALTTLQATRDIRKVALWLGHASTQTTEVYLQVNPAEKLETLEAIVPPSLRKGTFSPPDKLIASLKKPVIMRSAPLQNRGTPPASRPPDSA
jgi:integrase/recombinase XerD